MRVIKLSLLLVMLVVNIIGGSSAQTSSISLSDVRKEAGNTNFVAQQVEAALLDPPVANLFEISKADAEGFVTITGQPGAAQVQGSVVQILNLNTLENTVVTPRQDGSFSTRVFGSGYPAFLINQIKADQIFQGQPENIFEMFKGRGGSPNLILFGNPPDVTSNQRISFSTSGFIPGEEPPLIPGRWNLEATANKLNFSVNETLIIEGKYSLDVSDLGKAFERPIEDVDWVLFIEPIADKHGNPITSHDGISSVLTPTGEQIQMNKFESVIQIDEQTIRSSQLRKSSTGISFDFTANYRIEDSIPEGFYVLGWDSAGSGGGFTFPLTERTRFPVVLKVGKPSPPRLPWALFGNTFSNGTRGTQALEDRDDFQLSNKIVPQAKAFIIPMMDLVTGNPIAYRLEPFLVDMFSNDNNPVEFPRFLPKIPLRFPSGQLEVSVTKPDGTIDDLGSAAFQNGRSSLPGFMIDSTGGTGIFDPFELTTSSDQFNYIFTQYGKHLILMEGTVEDIFGNVYEGGGTYEVWVARPLDLDLGVLPGTPFEVGDVFNPVVRVNPAVSADIELDFKLFINSDSDNTIERSVSGKANRFGYFHPGSIDPIIITGPGEYQVDVTARYWDENGVLWMGSDRGVSVVETPNTPLIAHGRRGVTNKPELSRPTWFFSSNLVPGADNPNRDNEHSFHLNYAYFSGDVLWVIEDRSSIFPIVRVQDSVGQIADMILNRNPDFGDGDARLNIRELNNIGELPLLTSTPRREIPPLYPELIDQFGYYYATVRRPGVGVRHVLVGRSERGAERVYWFFDDPYNRQLGVGLNGDLPNDLKFQFGSGVFRDLARNINQYTIYASLAVIVPLDDPLGSRTFPPFQGAAGGPSGGPILTLKGREIDLFVLPTGTVPGSMLEVGDTFSFSGQIGPPLSSKVNVTVTAPSGKTHNINGQASKIGYFYKPASDFEVDESGIWRVRVEVVHDGMTSAGPVQRPFPTGDVLGSRVGEFFVYVVEKESALIELDPSGQVFIPAARAVEIVGQIPAGLSDAQVHLTVMMPGFILQEQELPISGSSFKYTYNPISLNRDFPNLDVRITREFGEREGQGPTGQPVSVDTVDMSFMISGIDSSGQPISFGRKLTLQGNMLLVDLTSELSGSATGPDRDGDGVSDDDDFCPDFPGKPETDGC